MQFANGTCLIIIATISVKPPQLTEIVDVADWARHIETDVQIAAKNGIDLGKARLETFPLPETGQFCNFRFHEYIFVE